MGKVCTETHAPGFKAAAATLAAAGVDRVLVVAKGDAAAVQSWAATVGVEAVADERGDFARLLGVDAPPGSPTPTHRYSALVEDGILLKLHVEEAPAKVTVTSADEMVKAAKLYFGK